MDLFKISQNTHIFGVIDPNLAESPRDQIERLLSKHNSLPKDSAPTTPRFLNNSDYVIKSDDTYVINGKHCNNFNKYYNTFCGIYTSPAEGDSSNNTNNTTNNAPSILNSDFFNPHASLPLSPHSSLPAASYFEKIEEPSRFASQPGSPSS